MISLCILVRNVDITPLVKIFDKNCPCDWELCVGDNSSDKEISKILKDLANEYMKITDKELFRGGIPEAHNRIAISLANTYKIFYLDADEIPIWINDDIEDLYSIKYVPTTLRFDFLTMKQIKQIDSENLDLDSILNHPLLSKLERSMQDRLYNCRYVKFNGLCHAIFHVLPEFRSKSLGAVILHNSTIRNQKNKERMDELIYEQYMRGNINNFLASSDRVLSWGKKIRNHKFKNWLEWYDEYV